MLFQLLCPVQTVNYSTDIEATIKLPTISTPLLTTLHAVIDDGYEQTLFTDA